MGTNELEWINPALKITVKPDSRNLEEALGISMDDIHRLTKKQAELTEQLYPGSDGSLMPPELILIASASCTTANELAWMMVRLGGFMLEEGAAEHVLKPNSNVN